MDFSFIIPVYNRPLEIQELLTSMLDVEGVDGCEIVIVEDGSEQSAEKVVDEFRTDLDIKYLLKSNSGPGDSRNYGMNHATHDYFIILDSDCLLPAGYLNAVRHFFQTGHVDCFGGPDRAHPSFTYLQKAIDYAMTSFLSTGGIRGKRSSGFQPRSFNMGLSRAAFDATGGFGRVHPGEDPDLVFRLREKGFGTALIKDAYVFHKRRIDWKSYIKQVYKFGTVRVFLNHWHPDTRKLTYWFPTLFSLGLLVSLLLLVFDISWPITLYLFYFFSVLVHAFILKGPKAGWRALLAVIIQMFSYGYGFFISWCRITVLGRDPETAYPSFFFKETNGQ